MQEQLSGSVGNKSQGQVTQVTSQVLLYLREIGINTIYRSSRPFDHSNSKKEMSDSAHSPAASNRNFDELSQQRPSVERELDELLALYLQFWNKSSATSKPSAHTNMSADMPQPVRYARRQRVLSLAETH